MKKRGKGKDNNYIKKNIQISDLWREQKSNNSLVMLITVFPHPSQNEILYRFPTFPDLMAHIPYQFYMKLCEIFLLTEKILKILDMRGHVFFYILDLSVIKYPLFVFELSYIFHTFENMKFPTFS